jgi:hypothetical protein
MKRVFGFIIAALSLAACTSVEDKAEELMAEVRIAVAESRYDDARTLIDSLRTAYPTAVEARREALVLENEFELACAKQQLAEVEQEFATGQTRLDSLKRYFVLEKDAKYQAVGYYVNPEQIGSNMHKTALRAQVNEEGQMVLVSIVHGRKINHKSIRVSLPSGETAETPSCFSFLTHQVAGYKEEASFRLGDDGGVIEFISMNSGTMTVTCLGSSGQQSFQLSPSDKFAVRHCYMLAKQFEKVKALRESKEKLALKVKFYERKMQM